MSTINKRFEFYRPMDLLKMEEKLDNGEYRSFTEFRTDFKLIVNNCRLYNGQSNGKFSPRTKQMFPKLIASYQFQF